MIEKLKKFIGIGVPGGLDDIVVRAVKTGVAVFLAAPVVRALGDAPLDLPGLKAAALAGVAAIISALINAAFLAVARWTSS